MTLKTIIERANTLADEQYDVPTMSGFILTAVSKFNIAWPAVVEAPDVANLDSELRFVKELEPKDPSNITPEEIARGKQLNAINDMFINTLIVPYVTYLIKVNDSSQAEYTDRMYEWGKNLEKMKATYGRFIKPEYLLESIEETKTTTGRVAFRDPSYVVYGNLNTFGSSPSGNTSLKGYEYMNGKWKSDK